MTDQISFSFIQFLAQVTGQNDPNLSVQVSIPAGYALTWILDGWN